MLRTALVRSLSLPALLCVAVACLVPALVDAGELTAPDARPPAANFELDNLSGDSIELSDFAGKVVVISFWATWCQPCLQELPHMDRFLTQYEDDGLVVLAITTDGPESQSEVRSLARRNRWGFEVLTDLDGSVAAVVNPRGTNPFTVFVDRQGRVASEHEGYSSGDEVQHEATIQALLAESL